jgi:hypothetical protein
MEEETILTKTSQAFKQVISAQTALVQEESLRAPPSSPLESHYTHSQDGRNSTLGTETKLTERSSETGRRFNKHKNSHRTQRNLSTLNYWVNSSPYKSKKHKGS